MPEKRGGISTLSFVRGAVGPETGKPIAGIAPDLGANEATLGNWVVKDATCKGAGAVA